MKTSPERPALRRGVIASVVAVLASGCSFVSVQRARPPQAVEDPRVLDTCTTSRSAAVADTVIGAAALVAGYAMILNEAVKHQDCLDSHPYSSSTCDSVGNPLPGLAVMGGSLAFAGSAIYGYTVTAQCRRKITAGGRCQNGDLGACQKLKPGWVPPPGWRAGPTLEPRPVEPPPAAPPPPAATPAPGSQEWTQEPQQPGQAPPPPSPR